MINSDKQLPCVHDKKVSIVASCKLLETEAVAMKQQLV